jgi:CMP-N,N'-diacetyllegionaminic acid synthase
LADGGQTELNVRTLAVIPARGGSKGIPKKNSRLLGGKPLLEYTVCSALASKRLNRVIVSTDDPEIAQIAVSCGANVPFLRPAELARDETPTLPVVQHAVRFLEEQGDIFEAICLLQPTNPFRTVGMIDGCLELLEKSCADSVVSVAPVPHSFHPSWVYFRDSEGMLRLSTGEVAPPPRRQLLPPAFHRDGSVYATKRDVLIDQSSLYGHRILGYIVEASTGLNLDTEEDWSLAESWARSA